VKEIILRARREIIESEFEVRLGLCG